MTKQEFMDTERAALANALFSELVGIARIAAPAFQHLSVFAKMSKDREEFRARYERVAELLIKIDSSL